MAVAVLLSQLVVVSYAAADGVDLRPDDLRPTIHLKATRKIPLSMESPSRGVVRSSKVTTRIYSGCRVDAVTGLYGCRVATPGDPADPEGPELTEGDILRAVREIGLPSLAVRVQPGDETLVNIETIFYTRPQDFRRSVELLGFDVDLVAVPVRYRWVHDDGTVSTTSRPGRPYPAMDVTHRYRKPAHDIHPRVDVTYRVRYRVDGGAWQTIGQTLQASGPAAELDVKEAAPVLAKP